MVNFETEDKIYEGNKVCEMKLMAILKWKMNMCLMKIQMMVGKLMTTQKVIMIELMLYELCCVTIILVEDK